LREKLIDKIPDTFYPVRVKRYYPVGIKRSGINKPPTEKEIRLWKRLYEELDFNMAHIMWVTGYTEVTVRKYLHKMGVKIKRHWRRL